MRTRGGLFTRILARENFESAMRRAALGKGGRPAVQRFLEESDHELERLRGEVAAGVYRPGPYRQFRVLALDAVCRLET